MPDQPDNDQVADMLAEVADLLERQGAGRFRVRSYRRAADEVRASERPVTEMLQEGGSEALQQVRGVGERLAGAIAEIVDTGRLGMLDRLRSEVRPEQVLAGVPGVGDELAERIHEQLGVESLAELETAAHEGRLEEVEGIGEKRLQGIRDALAGMLGRGAGRRARRRQSDEGAPPDPPVELLLELDGEYRRKAKAGELRTIAPRRFNPQGEAWLPVMKTKREGYSFTLLFSNTARAHELDKTDDWVVVYYERNGREGQCTVVTAGSGPVAGQRVVRGRERECREHYGEKQ